MATGVLAPRRQPAPWGMHSPLGLTTTDRRIERLWVAGTGVCLPTLSNSLETQSCRLSLTAHLPCLGTASLSPSSFFLLVLTQPPPAGMASLRCPGLGVQVALRAREPSLPQDKAEQSARPAAEVLSPSPASGLVFPPVSWAQNRAAQVQDVNATDCVWRNRRYQAHLNILIQDSAGFKTCQG